jgi:2-C-methyl-D-erythritol 4-phosphate cytidylyltransferase
LLIPAAGMGVRLGQNRPKALIDIAGKPMLVRALERFAPLGLVAGAVIVVTPGHRSDFERALTKAFPSSEFTLIDGGTERQDSVRHGLDSLDPGSDVVVIHDAARPFVSTESIQASIAAAEEYGAATVAIPCIDTILVANADQCLQETPDRSTLWACQTPQTFRVAVIRDAHAAAKRDAAILTDDASLVRRVGGVVRLVHGTASNFKITTPGDLALAECAVRNALV